MDDAMHFMDEAHENEAGTRPSKRRFFLRHFTRRCQSSTHGQSSPVAVDTIAQTTTAKRGGEYMVTRLSTSTRSEAVTWTTSTGRVPHNLIVTQREFTALFRCNNDACATSHTITSAGVSTPPILQTQTNTKYTSPCREKERETGRIRPPDASPIISVQQYQA